MSPAEGAAHRLALAVDDHERAGGFTPMLIRLALVEWRRAQDAALTAGQEVEACDVSLRHVECPTGGR